MRPLPAVPAFPPSPHPLYPSLLAPQTSVRRTQGMTRDRRGTEVRGHRGLSETRENTGKEGPGSFSRQAGGLDGRVGHLGQRDLGNMQGGGSVDSWGLHSEVRAADFLAQSTLQKVCPDTPENSHLLPPSDCQSSASASASLSSSMASTVPAQGPDSASSPPPFFLRFCPSLSLYCSSSPLPFLPSLLLPASPVPQ